MKDFKGKVAVVTGAGSGIGRAIAERCVQEGMKVVLADVEDVALNQAVAELCANGANAIGVRTDVSKEEQVRALAQRTLDAFGAVHLLFNNAGVGAGGAIWESTLADWQWVMGVNLWGPIHGIRVFVPVMLAQDSEGHIVNTASVAGLLPFHPGSPYQVTKHAVVGLTENLSYSLAERGAKIKASVLCPGWVQTRIMESERNRPEELQNEPPSGPPSPEEIAVVQAMIQAAQAGSSPAQIADAAFQGIRDERLYILTHPEFNSMIRQRMETMIGEEG